MPAPSTVKYGAKILHEVFEEEDITSMPSAEQQ